MFAERVEKGERKTSRWENINLHRSLVIEFSPPLLPLLFRWGGGVPDTFGISLLLPPSLSLHPFLPFLLMKNSSAPNGLFVSLSLFLLPPLSPILYLPPGYNFCVV